MTDKPKRFIGNVHSIQGIQENPKYVSWCEERIAELEKERDHYRDHYIKMMDYLSSTSPPKD